jgi:hypothetical protein
MLDLLCRTSPDQIDKPSIAQPSDADAARQSSLDGCLTRREERERDRHIDLSNAAFIPRRRWLDEMIAGTVTSVEQPRAIAATSVARVSARIGRRSCGGREAGTKNIASPPHRRLEKPPYLQSWIVPFGSLSSKTLKNALKFSNEPESTAMNKRIFSRLDALQKVVTET